jgi:hypothetical protein
MVQTPVLVPAGSSSATIAVTALSAGTAMITARALTRCNCPARL